MEMKVLLLMVLWGDIIIIHLSVLMEEHAEV